MFLVTFKVQAEESSSTNIIRYEGHSRENVAEAVAKAHFRDSNKVILVNRDKFPDAISATNISQGEHPVLYTHSNRVSDSAIELLKTMSLDEIYILGGELSINKEVVDQLQQTTNTKVTRIAGRSRYDANVSAVEENFTQKDHVVIASGEVYSDALYGVSYANTIDAPVILTNTNKLESSTHKLLKDLGVKKATIIGGNLTVTQSVEKQLDELNITHNRIAGRNRYIGSAEVANQSYEMPQNVVIASGEVFSDALVSAPLSQKLNAPILLVRPDRMEKSVENYLINHTASLRNIYIQGGTLSVSQPLVEKFKKVITSIDNVERETIKETLHFKTIHRGTNELKEGESRLIQQGINGQVEITYEYQLVNGVRQSDPVVVNRKVTQELKDEIIEYGTFIEQEDAIDWIIDTELFNQEKLKYINAERARVGVHALEYMPVLQEGVDIRANDLLEIGGLSVDGVPHARPDGSKWDTAFDYLDYAHFATGENLAMSWETYVDIDGVKRGERTLEDALAETFYNHFSSSPGHYANMISSTPTGFSSQVGIRYNDLYSLNQLFNVQIFGVDFSEYYQ